MSLRALRLRIKGQNAFMAVSELALGLVVLALGLLLVWKRLAAQTHRAGAAASPADHAASLSVVPRPDTALGELREFREALKPAEHSRVERRRPGGSGPYVGPDRRKSNRARATDPQKPLDRQP